jgi:hypothetical protein
MVRRLSLLLTLTAAVALLLPVRPAAADTFFACDPGAGSWAVVGRFGDGAVMESRICLVQDSTSGWGETQWHLRLRKVTSGVAGAIWDMNSVSDAGLVELRRVSPAALVTFRNYASDLSGSYILLRTPLDCDGSSNSAHYVGYGFDVRVYNPGTGTKSGYKDAITGAAVMNIGC